MKIDLVQRKLESAIDKEIEKQELLLKKAQKARQRLKDDDRKIHAEGVGASQAEVERSDAQIDVLRHQIEEEEPRFIAAEQLYSKTRSQRDTVGKLLVGLTDEELKTLDGLSHSYEAFAPQLAARFETGTSGESVFFGCMGCTAACGGCTGCGQACSSLNSCMGRPS